MRDGPRHSGAPGDATPRTVMLSNRTLRSPFPPIVTMTIEPARAPIRGSAAPKERRAERLLERPDFPVPRAHLAEHAAYARPLDLPPARHGAPLGHAVGFLIDTALAAPGEISLVTTTPLTNLALALAREPRLAGAFREVLTLGGIHAIGNVTPAADFNAWADPEAARAVLRAGLARHLLVPLDTRQQAPVTRDHCAAPAATPDPLARPAERHAHRRLRPPRRARRTTSRADARRLRAYDPRGAKVPAPAGATRRRRDSRRSPPAAPSSTWTAAAAPRRMSWSAGPERWPASPTGWCAG